MQRSPIEILKAQSKHLLMPISLTKTSVSLNLHLYLQSYLVHIQKLLLLLNLSQLPQIFREEKILGNIGVINLHQVKIY